MPDPVSAGFSPAEEAAWYARLPTMFAAAAALFTNSDGRVLLVKPNYRDHWSLAGGILEHGEPPHIGCRREVAEELGLDIEPGPLLVVGWSGLDGIRPKPTTKRSPRGQPLHEHQCHALIEARWLAGDRLAEAGGGHEDFPGRNVVARVPAIYRPGKERLERRRPLSERSAA